MVSRDFNAKLVLEQFADNPFLPKFYNEPDKYSFPLEMSFLAERYNQLNRQLRNFDLFSSFTVSDYYFMKSLIFAQNTQTGFVCLSAFRRGKSNPEHSNPGPCIRTAD